MSQQDALHTQHIYNTNIINPAYAGVKEKFNVTLFNRTQWVGLEGAPNTQTLNLDTPLGVSGLGLGVSFINDEIGPIREQLFNVDLAFRIQTSRKNNPQ